MMAQVVIVTPALADANNGNWQTARRWARFLAGVARVRLVKTWPDHAAGQDDVMIALHARRSAASIAAWHAQRGQSGLAVVLTGTDLYGDILSDVSAQNSLLYAQTLVVLQDRAPLALPREHRGKTRVILQSSSSRRILPKTPRHLRAVMVGHLRPEKSPETLFSAAHRLAGQPEILIDHIGGALEDNLCAAARATGLACGNYRWLGNLPRVAARDHIQRAHVLVHCSRIEGGAHVIIEALTSGTPVLASHIDGNIGMLGEDYGGYFEWNNAAQLADLLRECRATQADPDGLLQRLMRQAKARSSVFAPEREQVAVRRLFHEILPAGDD